MPTPPGRIDKENRSFSRSLGATLSINDSINLKQMRSSKGWRWSIYGQVYDKHKSICCEQRQSKIEDRWGVATSERHLDSIRVQIWLMEQLYLCVYVSWFYYIVASDFRETSINPLPITADAYNNQWILFITFTPPPRFDLGVTDWSLESVTWEMSLSRFIASANSSVFKVGNNSVPYNNSSTIKIILGCFYNLLYFHKITVLITSLCVGA